MVGVEVGVGVRGIGEVEKIGILPGLAINSKKIWSKHRRLAA